MVSTMAVRQKRPEPTLEEVDGLLEHVKSALEKWQKMPANHTALADYPELTEVVSQLVSWAPEFLQGQSLGIGPDLTRQILQRARSTARSTCREGAAKKGFFDFEERRRKCSGEGSAASCR
jgi:hypothetical protein